MNWSLYDRNVLVARETPSLLVKLSDVGMARTLKTSAYYRKMSDDKVCGVPGLVLESSGLLW